MIWITAAQRMEAEGLTAEVDLRANQTMRPQWQTDRAGFRGATYEDYHSLGVSLEIGLPRSGKGPALGRVINTGRSALAVGTDLAAGLCLKVAGNYSGSDSTLWLVSDH